MVAPLARVGLDYAGLALGKVAQVGAAIVCSPFDGASIARQIAPAGVKIANPANINIAAGFASRNLTATQFELFNSVRGFCSRHLGAAMARLNVAGLGSAIARLGSIGGKEALLAACRMAGVPGILLGVGVAATVGFLGLAAVKGGISEFITGDRARRGYPVGPEPGAGIHFLRCLNHVITAGGAIVALSNPLAGIAIAAASAIGGSLGIGVLSYGLYGNHFVNYPGSKIEPFRSLGYALNGGRNSPNMIL